MPSRHLSLRIDQHTLDRLDAHGRRERRTRSDVAKQLIEEGLRMQAHPGVIFVDGASGRRPALRTGPDVWEVARLFQDADCPDDELIERSVPLSGQSPSLLRDALRYYREYQDEIDEWIRRVDDYAARAFAEWQREQERAAS